jgi:NSS family neurotransmitter:Na+ symporter
MKNREQWGSKLGFILAASGSAVGIGNIWKYPHMAGSNGGAAFTLVYLLCILVVGMTIVIAEFAIGRKTQLSPVGAFETLAPNTQWKWLGFLGVGSAFVILSFYGVVGGWIIKYIIISLTGGFEILKGNPEAAKTLFTTFISSTWSPILFQVLFMALCIFVIINGVKDGIESWSKIMMPIIIVLLIVLAVRGLTLPGGSDGLRFLFLPRFDELTASAIVLALGHSFFTLSLGMGTMITYGSYLKRDQNLLNSALWVLALDTAIAMLAGVAIFTTVFALGADPAGGAGLIFFILPSVFPQLAYGSVWGTLFFSLLFMAALTSAISILEVVTAYFIDQKGWSRKKATIQFGSVITIVGVFCSLSMGGGINITGFLGESFFLGGTFFDVLDNLSSKYMLPIGGMFTALFILYHLGTENFIKDIKSDSQLLDVSTNSKVEYLFFKGLLFIAAIVVGFIILNEIISLLTGNAIIG